ncbi:MAG: hypothetical protein AAF403_08005, partial [Pseudomonadota bacterium]
IDGSDYLIIHGDMAIKALFKNRTLKIDAKSYVMLDIATGFLKKSIHSFATIHDDFKVIAYQYTDCEISKNKQ